MGIEFLNMHCKPLATKLYATYLEMFVWIVRGAQCRPKDKKLTSDSTKMKKQCNQRYA